MVQLRALAIEEPNTFPRRGYGLRPGQAFGSHRRTRDRTLAKNGAAKVEPPGWSAAVEINKQDLEGNHERHGHAIDLVNAPVDEEVARDTQQHHAIHEDVKETVVEDVLDTAEGGVEQRAGGDEEQTAMEFGFAAPGDGESHAEAEDEHVAEGHAEKCVRIRLVKNVLVKAAHDDSDDEAEHNHGGGQPDAKPAEGAMNADIAGTHQRGLKDVEGDPSCKCGAVNPEKEGARNRGMEEVVVDGVVEAPDNDCGDEQRHGEVEVFVDPAAEGVGRGLLRCAKRMRAKSVHRAPFYGPRGPDFRNVHRRGWIVDQASLRNRPVEARSLEGRHGNGSTERGRDYSRP